MEAVVVKTDTQKKEFIRFRKRIYRNNPHFVDNSLFMIRQLFASKTCFANDKRIVPIWVEDSNGIKCACIAIYTRKLPEYMQLSFFESEENVFEAVKMLTHKVIEIGKEYGATKLVVGLNGHVNYGLGLLSNHFDVKNSFGSSCNPSYYNEYFKSLNCDEIYMNTYKYNALASKFDRYSRILGKINNAYTFKFLEKDKLDYYSKIYTDLNNESFSGLRYYYDRTYEEDKEMLKELLLFMKPDSLIFAFKEDKPVGLILWYPDFNELVPPKGEFGAKTYIKNLFFNKKIKKAKSSEICILKEYRKSGLAIALLYQVILRLKEYGIKQGESSWVLEENVDSNSLGEGFCDGLYRRYVAYEKDI
ncbi:MAG: GNAT family N-acetyltransferase [Oscillospiraceae bacterium]|nr:GNAT family N-acetyltransferase [Oscillospiraceae bacterium]